MTSPIRKKRVSLDKVRRYLEPGPVVLVSSAWEGQRNIMTMGWHTVMAFSPSLVGCMISAGNHSFEMVRRSRECVINLPTFELTDQVIGIGNTSGATIDKFDHFGLSAGTSEEVAAPLVNECYANFECRLVDDSLVDRYGFFVWEVVNAKAEPSPEYPETLHYTGDGVFIVAGKVIDRREQFLPQML
ncbi:flavin reductase family protein [Marinobacter sp. 71-i]|uniref:Flavin reductase family protein n=1 Tax=Marinobacter iranensis TaxID=2962607 RepID=A0ABT5Y7S3_9GAMM|nr:flavin reductase family protein [Marinobacter iranensis]MDF0749728.1 flavin reductase family protein [Marinobacter iranensis]